MDNLYLTFALANSSICVRWMSLLCWLPGWSACVFLCNKTRIYNRTHKKKGKMQGAASRGWRNHPKNKKHKCMSSWCQNQLSIIGSGSDVSARDLFAWRTELNRMSLITYIQKGFSKHFEIQKKLTIIFQQSNNKSKQKTKRLPMPVTCDIRPCTCSTVIFALSRVILASGDSSCKSFRCHQICKEEKLRERERRMLTLESSGIHGSQSW